MRCNLVALPLLLQRSTSFTTPVWARARAAHACRLAAPPLAAEREDDAPAAAAAAAGHLFVVQGDVRSVLADAVLYPTLWVNDTKWFPRGPPVGSASPSRRDFTLDRRVHRLEGTASGVPEVYLGWLRRKPRAFGETDDPFEYIEWYLGAADQFLAAALVRADRSGQSPLCDRELPLFALPVIGTGSTGAKPRTGFLLSALLTRLASFVAANPVDIVLVTKTRRMFSAAQSARRSLAPLRSLTRDSYGSALGPRLCGPAARSQGRPRMINSPPADWRPITSVPVTRTLMAGLLRQIGWSRGHALANSSSSSARARVRRATCRVSE